MVKDICCLLSEHSPPLLQVLNEIYQNDQICKGKDTTAITKTIVTKLMAQLILTMKDVDTSFNALYERIHYNGSMYDGLKITLPNQFNLDIVLRLPIGNNDISAFDRWSEKGKVMNVSPGHVSYCTSKDPALLFHPNDERFCDWKKLPKLFEEKENVHYISPLNVKSWFESVIMKALNEIGVGENKRTCLCIEQENLYICTRKNGPAFTLHIEANKFVGIDIDLVPVFYFVEELTESILYLVPKPPETDSLQWRLSYAENEKEILHNNSCAKKVIKLLKRLRDMQGPSWKKLCSYHLKNFVLLELDNFVWDEKNLGNIFLKILNKLHEYLVEGKIPSMFDKEHNIISNIGSVTLENIYQKLGKIIEDIENNPPINMRKYFIKEVNSNASKLVIEEIERKKNEEEAVAIKEELDIKSLNEIINDVYNEVIILRKDTTTKAKEIVNKVLEQLLIPTMKSVDDSFRSIYQRIFYTGSFYDGLKVSEPNEFDLNIVLKLPKNNNFEVLDRWSEEGLSMNVLPGHVSYCSNKNPTTIFSLNDNRFEIWKKIEQLFTVKENVFHVSPLKVKSWFQSVVGKALNKIRADGDCIGAEARLFKEQENIAITIKESGPAWTLHIKSESCIEIDIDLVPVFYFSESRDDDSKYSVYIVPKSPENHELQWRLSYVEKEKQILSKSCVNNGCVKKVIKLLKRLRDIQSWEKLCSYHLKHFVILELENYTWDEKHLGEIFLSILNKLHEYLAKGVIQSIFDEKHNILSNVGSVTLQNINQRLGKIIKDIESNPPANIRKYFIKEC